MVGGVSLPIVEASNSAARLRGFLLGIVAVASISFLTCCERVSSIAHVIRNAGSDTMVNVAQAWAEHYLSVDPSVSVEVSGGGSATGIAALIDGSADLANSSRKIQEEEVKAAMRRTGKRPKEWIAGDDALAVYVHRDNPLNEISLELLGQIYGKNGKITQWEQLGVSIPGEIVLISRQSNSGTFTYFRQAILGRNGEFRQGTRDLNGSKEVVTLIGHTLSAIGYSGMGYATPEVKMLKISKGGKPAVAPSPENTRNRTYPIARPLYMYSLGDPSPSLRKYMDWILSPAGQEIVRQSGYVPLKGSE
jgi:phosphate transport system substrate-binding protein